MYKLHHSYFFIPDPCAIKECSKVANADTKCIPISWEDRECFYSCHKDFFPVEGNASNGCVNPCSDLSCDEIENGEFDHCEASSATDKECFYLCDEGFFQASPTECKGTSDRKSSTLIATY